ncbi:MAG TPA: glycoside hydrolase [Anaerolineae bacterium]
MGTVVTRKISRRDLLRLGGTFVAGLGLFRIGSLQAEETALPALTPKRIYIAPDDHTDYMWVANEDQYRQAFLDMLDYYLNLADTTAGNPPAQQSRWNCDGTFWVWVYERNRSSADVQRLVQRIRDGHVTVPLTPLVQTLGGAPAEAILRGLYYGGSIERRFSVRLTLATAMENQTLPYGLGALWAGAGAKYSWRGICGCASRVPNAWNRQYDIYWWTGPDGSRLLMKWNSMLVSNQAMGGYAEARNPAAIVEYVDSSTDFQARYPYQIIGCFGEGWDDLETMNSTFVSVAQTKTTATRTVVVSNEIDFFEDFEATYGTALPSLACSFGNEWELYSASMAEVSARVKRAVERLRSAEAMASLVSLQDPTFMTGRSQARDAAWMSLGLYWEHNWTADGVVSRADRAAWQRRRAADVENYVDTLEADVRAALGKLIGTDGTNVRFYAFNSLSWSRTDFADLPFADAGPVHVVDLAGATEVPSQIVVVDGQRRLRILAPDVPAVGYKVFEIRPGAGQNFPAAADVSAGVIQNARYGVTVAGSGAITSLMDKSMGNREFARAINGRVINDLGPGSGTLAVENAGPVTVTLLANATGPLNHTTRVTLIRDVDRIDVRNDITQNFDAVYTWGFGFEISNPDVWHEEVGAVIRARPLSQGGHYSPANARYDWLTLNHFADVSGGGLGVTLSNADCYFMQLGNSSADTLDTATPQISPLAGGQVDGSTLGIPAQGGDSHFRQRFALQTHGTSGQAAAMCFALEHQNPLLTGLVQGGPLPAASYSLLSISDPNVLLWALKPADDGTAAGTILRLWNLSTAASQCSVTFAGQQIGRAMRVTHVETPLGPASVNGSTVNLQLAGSQLASVAVMLGSAPSLPIYLPLILRDS